jgi:hypothetical protein
MGKINIKQNSNNKEPKNQKPGPKLVNIRQWEMGRFKKHLDKILPTAKYIGIISISEDGKKCFFTNFNDFQLHYELTRLRDSMK